MEPLVKILAALILLAGTATFALAEALPVPEIDANSATAAAALIAGGLLMLEGRRKKGGRES